MLFVHDGAVDVKMLQRRKVEHGGQYRWKYARVGMVEVQCDGLYVGPGRYRCDESSNEDLYSRASLFR